MKAIQVVKPGDVRIVELDMPKIETENQVLVKVHAGGICGSDIHVSHGTNPVATYPRIIGHEIAGEVVEIGGGVKDLKKGDRVVLEPITYCGECYACKKSRQNVCASLKVNGAHVDGGFQEYIVAADKQLHKIPDVLTYPQAALIEPYTIGAQTNWRAGVTKGDVVLVCGAGPIGLIAMDVAKGLGATCIVSEVNPYRLEMAKKFGADLVIQPQQEDLGEAVAKFTNNMGPNVVFEATGVNALFEQAVKIASQAGTVVTLALNTTPASICMADIVKKELAIVGTRLQNYKFKEVIESFPNKLDKVDMLMTHTFHFEDFKEAFRIFEDKNEQACKIVLTF